MSNLMKRGLALLLALVICVSFLPAIDVDAASGYIYNWGERGEVATSLSQNAEDFYAKYDTSYSQLSSYSGGSGVSSAPTSALYVALQGLMTRAHTYITDYAATRDLYKYTDCENGGGKISSFYSGDEIGPSWDGGSTWNREHTWPNSKGLGGNDENDLKMLRPTATSENGARGNKAYGKSSGYYNPNSESGGALDLRGDVARIFLYVYVRWGNVNGNGQYATWGASGVIESVDVLLEWMEADPVDTWELGRNDSVESITGTRNVFVDYPELAFVLFGEEIPENMATPSGEASRKCDHNNFDSGVTVPATCTTKGYVIFTCKTAGCGYSYKDNMTNELGHNYENGACTRCGEAAKPTFNALTELKNGDVVVIGAPAYEMALSAEKVATYYNKGVSYADGFDVITDAELFVVTVNSDGTYTFTSKTGDVIALAGEYSSLNVEGQHKSWTLEAKSGAPGVFYVKNVGRGNYLEWYESKNNWSTYSTSSLSNLFEISFYKLNDNSGSEGETGGTEDDGSCEHSYTTIVIAPTCTAGGFTIYICPLCDSEHTDDKIAATGHSYSGNKCTSCGAEKSGPASATISFADKANRTEFSTSKQVWEQNGIKVTNNKAAASSNVADYANPVRFYQGSDVIIEYPGIVKLEINCSGLESKYVGSWTANAPAGATVTSNNGTITLVFSSPVDSVTFTNLSKQSRAYSITVHTESGEASGPSCQHTDFTFEGALDASCTADGHTGKVRCTACNEIISDGKTIPATGHNWIAENCTRTCDRCGAVDADTSGDNPGTSDPGTDDPGDNNDPDDNDNGESAAKDHSKCEASGFKAFLNAIANFFRRLFGGKEKCVCGDFYE